MSTRLTRNEPRFPVAVILTALPDEYRAIREALSNLSEKIHPNGTVYEYGNFRPAKGQLWEIALLEIGAGNQEAALEAERAINHFRARMALFVGVAGGLKDVKIGDVVAGTKIYGYEAGKSERRFAPRPSIGESSYVMIQRARAEAKKSKWCKRIRGATAESKPRVFVGPIAAGEKVIASTKSSVYKFIKANYGDALAVEMEGRGFLAAAHANSRVDALVIRGISDLIKGKKAADARGSQRIAARHAAAFAFEVLAQRLVESRIRYRIAFEGTVSNSDKDRILKKILKQLVAISTDRTLEVIETREGSFIIVLEGSEAGFKRISSLIKTGDLVEIAGLKITSMMRDSPVERKKGSEDSILGDESQVIFFAKRKSSKSRAPIHRPRSKIGLWIRTLQEDDVERRKEAATKLGKSRDPKAIRPLIKAMNDRDKTVQWAAIQALGRIGDFRATAPLISLLNQDDKYTRWAVVSALATLGDHRAAPALAGTILDKDEDVRRSALAALPRLADINAVGPLIRVLRQLRSGMFHVNRRGDEDAIEAWSLLERTKIHPKIAQILGGIGVVAMEQLLEALRDSDEYVSSAASLALGTIGSAAVEPLTVRLKDPNKWVRIRSAIALGKTRDQKAVKPLIEILDDSDDLVWEMAIYALGELGDARAVEPLIATPSRRSMMYRSSMSGPRGEAVSTPEPRVMALVRIGEPAVERLIVALQASQERIQRTAAEALGRIGDKRAVQPLISALMLGDKWLKQIAAEALGNIRDVSALASLRLTLKDIDVDVQRKAAAAIRQIQGLDPTPTESEGSQKFG